MSLVADYDSSSDSEDEHAAAVPIAPITPVAHGAPLLKQVVAKGGRGAPKKIIVVKPNTTTTRSNLTAAADHNNCPKENLEQDQSLSLFGKPSIASFLPPPKNRKSTLRAPEGNGSQPSTSSAVKMDHQLSKQTRTLGGGIKNRFFDGEISMGPESSSANQPLVVVPVSTLPADTSEDGDSEAPPAKRVKVIPAAVLARQAKAAKLAKLGKPIPAHLTSSPSGPTVSHSPVSEPLSISPAELVEPVRPKQKLSLPSLFGLETPTSSRVKPGPSLPTDNSATTAASEYQPIMLEPTITPHEISTMESFPETVDPTPSTLDQDDVMAEITKHELGNSRKRAAAAAAAAGNNNTRATSEIIDFSMDDFYQNNQDLRQQGQLDEFKRPVKAIGGGRHQLTSLLRSAQSNKEGLEEMYAQNRRTKKETGSKYGF